MADGLVLAIAYLKMSYFEKQCCFLQKKMGVVGRTSI
jgi:hypothetical protein